MNIRFIPQEEIDKTKWNSCVHFAPYGNVFGYKWFLDNTAKEWDGLVENDYESVMPIIHRKNWFGRKELYIPNLIREAGIYSVNVLSQKRVKNFIQAIPEEYKKGTIHFNAGHGPELPDGWKWKKQSNYMLLLEPDYETIRKNYKPELLQKLETAEDAYLVPGNNLKPEKLADFYKTYFIGHKNKSRNYHALMRLSYNALHRGSGFASSIIDNNANLCAVAFFIYGNRRLFNLISVVSPAGKKLGALEMLYDLMIQNNAGRPLIMDFNISGKENFPVQFGADELQFIVGKFN